MKSAKQIASEIGRRIRNARTIACLSLDDLSYLSGIGRRRLEDFEKGDREPSMTEAIELAEHCDTTVAYLAGEEEYGEPIRGFMGQIPFTTKGIGNE